MGYKHVKSILLNLTNVETAYFYSTSGKTYKQGQNVNLSTISGGYSANQSAVSIVFNNKVSMAAAQDYIRNNIVIKPIVNQDVQVTLTVSDGVLSTSSTSSITQAQWNGTQWTVKAGGTYSSWWIGSSQGVQYVYFTGNCTFNGDINGWGGLEIYGTCYLYIPKGVTITCNGVAGDGSRQGGAGIYLASGNTLYVLGGGTLVANGGKAGNGSNGWVGDESYTTYGIDDIQSYAYLVKTTYTQGNIAGSQYDIYWDEAVEVNETLLKAKDILSNVLYNYDLTLLVEENNVVNKKVINIDEYEFNGYSSIYDGLEHTLVVLKNGDVLTNSDELVSFTIKNNLIEKYIAKNVVDSGEYIATIALKDTDNYVFSESTENYWTVESENTVASVSKQVSIAPKTLNVDVEYTSKVLAELSVSGFVENEDETFLTNFTYLLDETPIGDTVLATTAGEYEISAQNDNLNYSFTTYKIVVFEISFASGEYNQSVAGAGEVPHNIPQNQYVFSGYDADLFDEIEVDGIFKADMPQVVPTLKHYTFKFWSTNTESEFDFDETVIDRNITIYAIWVEKPTHTITYKYKVDSVNAWNNFAVDTFYTDDLLTYDGNLRTLDEKNWFVGRIWYLDENLEERFLNKSYLSEDIVLYGHYQFDIGICDVNADGNVNANDITLYREWIVGGYNMIVVETGDEWETVNSEEFNTENIYFVKRVADSNAPTSHSVVLGDNALDIRDVSTIRMALVGGFGFDVATGVETTNDSVVIISVSEINSVSKLLITVAAGKKAKLSSDINEESAIVDVDNLLKDVVIDLNGKTITVPSFSLALASNYDGKIQISNGSIISLSGINLLAPNGTIILNNVTLYDENGEFTLQAANQSLHFEGNVSFFKNDGNGSQIVADVVIPSTTHVVIENNATVMLKNIVVEQIGNATLSIEVKNSQTQKIAVQGDYQVSGSNSNIVDEFVIANSFAELLDFAPKGYKIRLGSDIEMTDQVVFMGNSVLDLNGKTLSNTNDIWNTSNSIWSLISVQGGTLTITGNGHLFAKENDCYAVDVRDGANLIVENGEFVGNIHAIYVFEGNLIVNGGTFRVQQQYSSAKPYEFTLNMFDANGLNGTATIVVNGGSFYKFNPSNCKAEGEETNFVAEGNTVLADGDYFVVSSMQ